MKLRLRIPLVAIMLTILLFMSVVPFWLIRVVIRQQAQSTVEGEVAHMTQGILEVGQNDFNHRLRDLDSKMPLPELLSLLSAGKVDVASLTLPDEFGQALVVPYAPGKAGLRLFRQKSGDPLAAPYGLQVMPAVDLSRSDTLAILSEKPGQRLWLGRVPAFPNLPSGIWMLSKVASGPDSYLVALALDRSWIDGFVNMLSIATRSSVSIITADNVVLPNDEGHFFDRPWAARAISRTQVGRFISFSDQDTPEAGSTEVLIHVFADPDYLYNLVVVTPRSILIGAFNQSIDRSGAIIFGTAALFSLLSLMLVLVISRRFRSIRDQFTHVAEAGYPALRPVFGIGVTEVEVLVDGLRDMKQRLNQALGSLQESQAQLQQSNAQLEAKVQERTKELEGSLSSLIETQELLIQNEKMAALGRAASSFTHEINSPLGVSNLAVTQMSEALIEMVDAFEKGGLSKQGFVQGTGRLMEASGIIERNLRQASAITASFKHVAIDQGSNREQEFDLGDYLREVIATISPKLRQQAASMTLSCAPKIVLRRNPAIFYQILSNLVNNSLLHGFEGRSGGLIELAVEALDNQDVRMSYRDNGAGMSGEAMEHIWEPYFTTKAGKGGSGLGMHIIHGLVTEALQGSIECQSSVGSGVHFIIQFPGGGR